MSKRESINQEPLTIEELSRATTMNKSEKYSEIILLGQMLQENDRA